MDGTLLCWGKNNFGEVGNGEQGDTQPQPAVVAALGKSVMDVSAGFMHTCAVQNDGKLWCWGGNSMGTIGDGTRGAAYSTPRETRLTCSGS